jgi:DNA-binding PadR family transcriptional regulator
MHSHHEHEHEHERFGQFEEGQDWGRGRRGRGRVWFGAPWAGPGDMPGPMHGPWPVHIEPGGPNRMWFFGGGPHGHGGGGPFGPGGPGGGGGWGGRGRGRGGRGWGRARRGDVRSAILALLAERPMHGYEIIGELTERTDGLWRPSPGSIYPTLQLLEDEGLVTAQADEAGGKRRYALTEEGQRAAADVAKGPAPWDALAAGAPEGARALRQAVVKLMPVVRQVMVSGGPREYEEVAKLLDETRRRVYAILANEPSSTGTSSTGTSSTGTSSTGTSGTGTAGTGTSTGGAGEDPEGEAAQA